MPDVAVSRHDRMAERSLVCSRSGSRRSARSAAATSVARTCHSSSNRMDYTMAHAELMYFLPGVSGLRLDLGAAHAPSGRNVGQSTIDHDGAHLCAASLSARARSRSPRSRGERRLPRMLVVAALPIAGCDKTIPAQRVYSRDRGREHRRRRRHLADDRAHRAGPGRGAASGATTSAAYSRRDRGGEVGPGDASPPRSGRRWTTGRAVACFAGTRSSASSSRDTICLRRRAPMGPIRSPTRRIPSRDPEFPSPIRHTRRAPTATSASRSTRH